MASVVDGAGGSYESMGAGGAPKKELSPQDIKVASVAANFEQTAAGQKPEMEGTQSQMVLKDKKYVPSKKQDPAHIPEERKALPKEVAKQFKEDLKKEEVDDLLDKQTGRPSPTRLATLEVNGRKVRVKARPMEAPGRLDFQKEKQAKGQPTKDGEEKKADLTKKGKQEGVERPVLTAELHTEAIAAKRAGMIATGASLSTSQGPDYELHSAVVNACTTSHLARTDRPTYEKVFPDGVPKPKELLRMTLGAISDFIDDAELDDATLKRNQQTNPEEYAKAKGDCNMLNGLAGLMHKSWNPEKGGMGSMSGNSWKPEWNTLGSNRVPGRAFDPSNPSNNQELKEEFKEMMQWYSDNIDAHFSEDRHVGGREIAGFQVAATIGQLVQDFAGQKDFAMETRLKFTEKLQQSGVVHDSMEIEDGQLASKILQVRGKFRASPLLAEVATATVKKEIVNGLQTPAYQNDILNMIKDQLRSEDSEGKLSEEKVNEYAERILDKFNQKVADTELKTLLMGSRGRVRFGRSAGLGGVGETVIGSKGVKLSIAKQPNRENDKISDEWVKSTLGRDAQMKAFEKAVSPDGDNILKHDSEPKNVLHLDTGLETCLKKIISSDTVLRSAINDVLKEEQDPNSRFRQSISQDEQNAAVAALQGLSSATRSESFNESYENIVGGISITFNKATGQKMTFKELAKKPSVASIMMGNNLRTISSISGTTTDMLIALVLVMGEEEAAEFLQPLLNQAQGKKPDLSSDPGGTRIKEMISGKTALMQGGAYHTAAEVVGGMFIAARALCSEDTNTDVGETFEQFSILMKQFADGPESFLNVSDDDLSKIANGMEAFKKSLAKNEKKLLAERQAKMKTM